MSARHLHARRIGRYLPPVGSDFISIEVASGLALMVASVAALVWINVDPSSYTSTWSTGLGPLTAQEWVNDVLMAVFFFVVGLEIKREVTEGELASPRRAALPAIAAIGGMVVPALVYTAWNLGGDGARGWGIPMATDIAFALGVLALLGSRVRPEARVFLLALAIVDDIGAIIVIALFYSSGVAPVWLVAAAAVCVVVVLMRRIGFAHPAAYLLPGVALWLCVHEAGVHATIAGVVLALLLPTAPGRDNDPVEQLETALHPWTGFLIIPLFALANAGVLLTVDAIERASTSPVTAGVFTGLVIGKVAGVVLFVAVAVRLGIAHLPRGLDRSQVFAVSIVAGIGFTVSLFVAELSFEGALLREAKTGVLAASLVAALLGAIAIAARHTISARTTRSKGEP
jgi:NhaA family Na+:H+ antiporter